MAQVDHSLESYDQLLPELMAFPKMVTLSVTYVCNALCPSCPYTNSNIRADYKDAKFIDADLFKKIAIETGAHGAWLRITGGGEPFLHKQMIELLEFAKEKGCKIGVINNGSMLNDEKIERVLKADVDMIEFSVDAGTVEEYDIARKGLNFEQVTANVKKVYEMRNKLKSKTKINASAIMAKGIDVEQAEKYWSPYVDVFQKRKYLTWGVNDLSNSASLDAYLPPEERAPCPIIFDRIFIDTHGRVAMCIYDIKGKTDMGNINEQSIQEVWTGKAFEEIRQLHLSKKGHCNSMCNQCEDWKYRSWNYNYFHLVDRAEKKRNQEEIQNSIEQAIS